MEDEKEIYKRILPAFKAIMALIAGMSYRDIGFIMAAVISEMLYEIDPNKMERNLTELMVYTKNVMAKRKKMGDLPPDRHLEDQ